MHSDRLARQRSGCEASGECEPHEAMTCPSCRGTELVEFTARHDRALGGKLFSGKLRARTCNACDRTVPDVFDLGAFELAVARVIARAGEASAEELRFMRCAIGYDRSDEARALKCTVEDLAGWEAGQEPIPPVPLALLRALVLARTARVEWFPVQVQRAQGSEPPAAPARPSSTPRARTPPRFRVIRQGSIR